jgi:GNAT superfamily N-acetyltransferase
MHPQLKIQRFRGKEILTCLHELAKLRIEVFREYPYLYDGDLSYEEKYLQTYIKSDESVLVVVIDDNKVVGASTALPMRFELPEIQRPFVDNHYDINSIFYFGESVLLPTYRKQGIGKRFFEEREKAARESGQYKLATFCAVMRPTSHPSQPPDYQSLHTFWQQQGFKQHLELQTSFSWKEIGESTESRKPMVFWLKSL